MAFTPLVVSVAFTVVPVGVSDIDTDTTSPGATEKRNDPVPAAPETNVTGTPFTHSTFTPALATYCPRVSEAQRSTVTVFGVVHEKVVAAGSVISAATLPTTGAE